MIRNLIFDFGNVLVHYEYETFFRSLVQDEGRRSRLVALVNSPDSIRLMERGCKPLEEIVVFTDATAYEFALRKALG